MSGLYLVTTPIGNNTDFTARAISSLESASRIYCEDTRVFRALAKACNIDLEGKVVDSFHDHSSNLKLDKILDRAATEICAFVSDAGSPIISDPAFPLVKLAIERGVNLKSIGGVSAPLVALELSGLAPIPFHFHGFLARDKSKKNKDFDMVGSVYGTHIFFEGVSRVLKTLEDITLVYPEFEFVVARELTKSYESVYRFKGCDFSTVKDSIVEKGEFTILVNNPDKDRFDVNSDLIEVAQEILDKGAKMKLIAKLIAQVLGENSKEVYAKLNQSK